MSLFWGICIVLFDLNIGAGAFCFDLFPDVIGWILISDGIENIFFSDPQREKALRIIRYMEVLSLLQMIVEVSGLSDYVNEAVIYNSYQVISVFQAFFNVIVLNYILKRFEKIERDNAKYWNASSVLRTFRIFSIVYILMSLLYPVFAYFDNVLCVVVSILIVIICAILFLIDLYQTCYWW